MADEVKEEFIPLDLNNAPEEERDDRMLDGLQNEQEDEDEKSENEHHVGKDNSVYVSEIARGTSDEELQKAFEKCAPVKEAFVVRNKYTKETKGFGFVTFFNKEDMFKCIDWDTLPRFKDRQTGRMQVVKITPADPKNTLHIGNIPKNVTEEELKQHVLTYGKEPFEEFELCTDADGKPKGYAWVKFKDHDQALKTMKALKKGTFQGKVLYVSFAEPRVVDSRLIESVKSLFVKNVASSVNEAQLMTLFGGSVEKVVIPLDKKRRVPLGHAFVHFRSREEANDAMTQFNGYELEGRRLTIEWCIPQGVQRNQKKSTKPVNYGMPYPPMPHHHGAPYPGYFYGYPPPGPSLWPARANTHAHGAMPPHHHVTPRPAQGMEHHHKAPAAYQGYDYWPSYGKPPTERDQRGAYAAPPQYGQYYAAYPPSSMMYPGYPPSSTSAAPSKSRYRPY